MSGALSLGGLLPARLVWWRLVIYLFYGYAGTIAKGGCGFLQFFAYRALGVDRRYKVTGAIRDAGGHRRSGPAAAFRPYRAARRHMVVDVEIPQTAPASKRAGKDEWENVAADYDVDTANELLDELGLTEKDRFGIRIAPNGEPLQIVIEFPVPRISTEAMELVKEYWEAVGVKVLLKPESNFGQRRQLNQHDARVDRANNEEVTEFAMGAEYHTCYRSRGIGETAQWVPCGSNHAWGHNWGRWLAADAALTAGTHTLADFEGGEMPGEEPPEDVKMLDQWGQEWVKTEYGSPEYIELAQKIFDFQARNLVIIGVVGLKPVPLIAKRNIGNIPTGFTMGMEGSTGLNVHGDQFFFKN